MATLGTINCNTSRKNTGFGSCAWEPDDIRLAIAVKKGYSITNSDITDPETWINELIHNDNSVLRGYPLPPFVTLEQTVQEAQSESFGYGGSERAGMDFITWMARWRKGMRCSYNAVASFSDSQDQNDWIFMDRKGRVLMWSTDGVTAYAMNMMGVHVPPPTPGDNSTNPSYQIEYKFEDADQWGKNLIAIETGISYKSMTPIQTLNLVKQSEAADGVYGIKLLEACGNVNLGETYGTELAVTGAWRAYNSATGAAITVSAVSYNSITGIFSVNLDENDADYPSTGDDIRITLAPPNTLESSYDVAWYEGSNLTVQAT